MVCWLVLAGCRPSTPAREETGNDRTLAIVANEPILRSQFEAYVTASVGQRTNELDSRVLQALLEQLIEERLVIAVAVERGLVPAGSRVNPALEELVGSLPAATIDQEQSHRFYLEHQRDYQLAERVELYQVLVEERAQADEAIRALERGEPFSEVARRLSIDPSAQTGGLQGEFARADLPPKLAGAVFALGEGRWSAPVAAEYGFHVFYVARRFPAREVPFGEARQKIEEELAQRQRDDALRALLRAARAGYNVSIVELNLPWRIESDGHPRP